MVFGYLPIPGGVALVSCISGHMIEVHKHLLGSFHVASDLSKMAWSSFPPVMGHVRQVTVHSAPPAHFQAVSPQVINKRW